MTSPSPANSVVPAKRRAALAPTPSRRTRRFARASFGGCTPRCDDRPSGGHRHVAGLAQNPERWFTSTPRMAYRATERTERKRAAARESIVTAARELIARGGYGEAQVAAVAARAGVATGSVYRHFPSKADLFAEVFRGVSQREVDAARAAAAAVEDPTATRRLRAAIETFARRALSARRQAW